MSELLSAPAATADDFVPTHRVIGDAWSGSLVVAGARIQHSDFRFVTFANGERSTVHVNLLLPINPHES